MINSEKNLFINENDYITAVKYYREIMDIVSENPLPHPYENTPQGLFRLCQEYYWYYLKNNAIQDVKNVLKNYIDEENYISQSKGKFNKEHTCIDIEEKLYVETLLKIWEEKYQNTYTWTEICNNNITLSNMIDDFYEKPQSEYIKKVIQCIDKSPEYAYKKPNISKTHNAMKVLEDALNLPKPTLEESVATVLIPDVLNNFLEALKLNNTPYLIFTSASITKALTFDSYHKKTNVKGNTSVFFNLPGKYNLDTLKNYFRALDDLLYLYKETKTEISNLY